MASHSTGDTSCLASMSLMAAALSIGRAVTLDQTGILGSFTCGKTDRVHAGIGAKEAVAGGYSWDILFGDPAFQVD